MVSYRQAQENTGLRRVYINSLNWKRRIPWVNKIIYELEKLDEDTRMYVDTRHFFEGDRVIVPASRRKYIITINPHAFSPEAHPNEADFLCSLYHHEGYHAREMQFAWDFFWKVPDCSELYSNNRLRHLLNEYRAYTNESDHLTRRNSSGFSQEILAIVNLIEQRISEHVPKKMLDSILAEHQPLW